MSPHGRAAGRATRPARFPTDHAVVFLGPCPRPVAGAQAATRTYAAPDEAARLAPGPHPETGRDDRGACHSPDHVSTRLHGPASPRAFQTAEVFETRHIHGAPIGGADVPQNVECLVRTYGA